MRKLIMACINEYTMLKLICARDLPLEMFKEKENSNEIFSAGNNQFDCYKMLKLAMSVWGESANIQQKPVKNLLQKLEILEKNAFLSNF